MPGWLRWPITGNRKINRTFFWLRTKTPPAIGFLWKHAAIIAFLITILSLWLTILQIRQAEPALLNVTESVNKEIGVISITFENIAKHKETGIINFFQLEVNDFKPVKQYPSLKPGSSRTVEFPITVAWRNITVIRSLTNPQISIPLNRFYSTPETSLSYRITCDNCYSQGIIRRLPAYEEIVRYERDFMFTMEGSETGPKFVNFSLQAYSWNVLPP